MLSDEDKVIIRRSWRLVRPITETVSELFYKRLFELKPEYRSLFPESMDTQRRKLIKTLNFAVKSLEWDASSWETEVDSENDLFFVVLALGRRHSNLYHVPDSAYAPVGEALLWTLEQGLGDAFTQETRAAWTRLYKSLSALMLMSSAQEKKATRYAK